MAGHLATNRIGKVAIKIGHGFEIPFGVPGGQAHALAGGFAQPRLADAGTQDAQRLIEGTMDQAGGFFLPPFQTALVAVDTDFQRVLFTRADLAGDQHTTGAIGHLEQHRGVIVQLPAIDVHAQHRAQVLDGLVGDKLGQGKGVGADIADASAQPGLFRQITPGSLLVALPGHVLAQPALGVLDNHLAHRTDHPAAHHLPRLPDHRIAQVSVGQAVESIAARDDVLERQQFGQIQCRRFFAEHVKPCTQGLAGHRCMQVIGGDDDHQFHALPSGQGALGFDHLPPVAVAA
ncbi:hypothetical protein D3C84_746540 [compost metagenome]